MARKVSGRPRLVTISVKVSREIQRELHLIAEEERRTVSQTAHFLIENALAARRAHDKRKKSPA